MNTRPAITLASLAHHQVWVGWRKETRNGQLTPYDPTTGRLASAHDPDTWATHDEADGWAATNGAAGVGLMLSQIDDAIVGGIHLDGSRDPDRCGRQD
jgi:primase-polymerase (primpol)-like protein